jgi:AraC-like DNA-binding protein
MANECQIGGMERATRIARVELTFGGFDALSATHFVQRFPPHFHDTFAIGVIESGATHLRTRRGEWLGRPGTILAFSPGEMHSADPLADTGYTYRMVYPTVEFMRRLGVEREPLFTTPVIDDPALGRALHDAHIPIMEGVGGHRAELRLLGVLGSLVTKYAVRRDVPAFEDDARIVEQAQSCLRDQFASRPSLDDLAKVCAVSPFQLIRKFRRVLGVTPFAYLAQFRVNRAQAMLASGNTLSDVAYSCGFSDQSHMTRAFKQVVGIPPGQYARALRATALR